MEEKQKVNENEHTYDNGFHPKEVKLKENYKLYRYGFFYNIAHFIVISLTKFFLIFPKIFVWGFKTKGKKYKKHMKGSMIVSNHTHPCDALIIGSSLWYRSFNVAVLQSNLGFGLVSTYFRLGGAVPIPEDKKLFKRFNTETVEHLKKGKNLLIYPEAALMPFCDHIRDFKSGAFQFAVMANCKIIPTVFTYHKPKGFYKLTRRKKPCIHYNILPPYTIKDMGNKRLTVETATKEIHEIMSNYFNEHSDYFKKS
ncbi:MAG: 1-acyl-sn-glycerol-3-phosphate acyltransferase [Acholeplasmatales bacterium]|nr:1-acyl-sn-glycerol-3-phosphate acyltransferase [Acholeplasmatales bacterium]